MTRRSILAALVSALFAIFLVTSWGAFNPLPALAEDQARLLLQVKVDEKAPDFSQPSSSSKAVRLSDFAGQNVLIDFYEGYW